MTIKQPVAIILDVDDTLYDQVVPFQTALNKHITFPKEHMQALFLAFRHYSDEVFEASQSGQMTMEEMHIYRMTNALQDYGYTISKELALAIQYDYAKAQKQIVLDNDMKDLIIYCKQHNVKLGIITNGPTEHQWNKVKQLGVLEWIDESCVFVSQEVGVSKPSPQIFELAEQRLNLEKTTTYYVGDSYDNDVVGSKQAGWQCIWLNVYNKPMTQQYKPDVTVTNRLTLFEQVKNLLKNN